MEVKLLNYTPLWVCSNAARTCWASQDKSDSVGDCTGEKDKELIERVGNKFKHKSILEHISYNFFISGISRACLQEVVRHRTAKLSVKSSRYTLKELKEEISFVDIKSMFDLGELRELNGIKERAKKYIVLTGDELVDFHSIIALELLRLSVISGKSNDITKYNIPECYKTELTWTMDARNLQNFFQLRSSKSALWEIQDLAREIFNALPEEHKYLFADFNTK